MKIWLLNNTKLDKNKDNILYFNEIFIPLLKKYSKDGDIILHLGNIFHNSDLIPTKLLNNTLMVVQKIAKIRPFYFLDGYDTELLKLFKTIKNTIIVDKPLSLNNCKLIPKKFNIIEHINLEDKIVFINSKIDQTILEKYNIDFYCGFYDLRKEHNNIINIGTPYQLDKKSSSGIYIIDTDTRKKKYLENNKSLKYEVIRITDVSQIDTLDAEYIRENNISIEIDKSLIDEKKIKIDILLNNYDFKSISYINDNKKDLEIVDSSSLKMEELLLEKIKNSDNTKLLSEFQKIMNIYKEKY